MKLTNVIKTVISPSLPSTPIPPVSDTPVDQQKSTVIPVQEVVLQPQGLRLVGTPRPDTLNGSEYDDLIIGKSSGDTLVGNAGNDVIRSGKGNDKVSGDAGNDVVRGNQQGDKLFGGEGDDILFGGLHNDRLNGGNGKDTLIGNRGKDVLRLGNDSDMDVVVFRKMSDKGDVVRQFRSEDKIDISALNSSEYVLQDNGATTSLFVNNVEIATIHGNVDSSQIIF